MELYGPSRVREFDEGEAELAAFWPDEVQRRSDAWDAGETKGIPGEKVLRELTSTE